MKEAKTLWDIRLTLNEYENTLQPPKKPEGYGIKDYVYDENATVKQNRLWQKEDEQKYQEAKKLYMQKSHDLRVRFENDIYNALETEYKFNKKQSEILLNYCADDKHSYGLLCVVDYLIELADVVRNIMDKD